MLDIYSKEAYTVLTDRLFVSISLQALYKGSEESPKALKKLMEKEMPSGFLTISCKRDYNKVDWAAVSRELERHFKAEGLWHPDEGTVKLNRVVGL